MFEVVQNWFDRESSPIGIDFGTDCLRLAQVELRSGDARLVAAASIDVPSPIRDDQPERLLFLQDAIPELLRSGNFRGRRAVLGLPAASAFIQHFVLPSLESNEMHAAVTAAVHGVVPADATDLLIRRQSMQSLAGGLKQVIAVGAARSPVVQMLTAAQEAGLNVVAMNTEPGALTDFYIHVYRRYSDRHSTTAIIDIGFTGSRMLVVRDQDIVLAHGTLSGGRQFAQAVADAMQIDLQAARMLRLKHSRMHSTSVSERAEHVVYVAPSANAADSTQREQVILELAARPPIDSLARALKHVKDEFEASETGSRIDRLLFVGGESRDQRLCERIARQLGVTACVGDPLLRMGRMSDVCVSSGIDRRQPQPAWAVAVGLSLGPRPGKLQSHDQELSDPTMPQRV